MHTHGMSGSLGRIAGQIPTQHSHGDRVIGRKQRRKLVRDAREDVPQLCQLVGLRKLPHDAHELQHKFRLLAPAARTDSMYTLHSLPTQPS